MKIKYRFGISIVVIAVSFVSAGIIGINNDLDISQVAEYHDKMSIPALTLLEQISSNSEKMHRNIHGVALGHEHAKSEYKFHLQETRDLISEYDKLSYRLNSQNEYLASQVMQVQMLDFVLDMSASLDRYDISAQEFFSVMEKSNLRHEEILEEFFDNMAAEMDILRDILNQDKQMEYLGLISQQEKITELRNIGDYLLIFMIIIGITAAVLIPFLNSRWVSKHVDKIKNTMDEISKGNLDARIDTKGNKDEFSEISEKINFMALQLSDFQTKLVNAEKFKIKKELKEAKEKRIEEVLYEVIPDYVVTIDNNDLVEDCNKKVVDAFGYSKDEIVGMPVIDFMIKEDKKKFLGLLQRIKNGEQVMEYDLHIKRKDGSITHSIWNSMPMYGENNEYVGYIATGVDLIEIDKLRDEIAKKEKITIVGHLAANIAHDLRNPLSIIQISLENLKNLYGTDDIKQMQFDRVERSIDRMTHQMDNVLNFIKEQPLTLNKTKMSEVISESLDSLTIPSEIKLILPENDIELFCDKIQLAVSLNNIILNGIQAIVGLGTIEISVEENNAWIVIKVKDSGDGITKEELEIIFDPLFTTKQKGTGLGLASVKSIIGTHGGTISVTSHPTIFTITLPKTLENIDN